MFTGRKLLGIATVGAIAVAFLVGEKRVVAQEGEGPNLGNVSVSGGINFTDKYFFRGIAQENEGLIVQTNLGVAFDISPLIPPLENVEAINNLSVYVGIWNSWHDRSSPSGAAGINYEQDYIVGMSIGLMEHVTMGVEYVAYTSPNGTFATVQEIAVYVSLDDAGLWGIQVMDQDLSLNPHMKLAFEIGSGQADGGGPGTDQGVYFEVGIEPSLVVLQSEDYPVRFSVPIVLGLSLDDDYYEAGSGAVKDVFGYVDVGLVVSVPLGFMPSTLGAWEANIGVHFLFLGNSAQLLALGVTGGDDFNIYGMAGISFEY